MTTTNRPPLKRVVQARVMRIVNVPMRALLGLPFSTPLGGRLMLLYLTGRKTGRAYRQPVSYVRDGAALLTPGGGKWKRNLIPGQPVHIRLRGKDILATPAIIRNPDEVEPLLELMVKANPMAGKFVGIPRDAQGHLDGPSLKMAIDYGFAIVRWQTDGD